MNENFGKNFIPQKRIDLAQAGLKIHNTVDTFTAVSVLIFSATLFVIIGIFTSGFFINYQIESLQKKISVLTSRFMPVEVDALVSLSGKISAVDRVISEHTSITDIRTFLEDNTPTNVQVLTFVFDEVAGKNGSARELTIEGEAASYNTLANQSNILKMNKSISGVSFSNITPTEQGTISFKVTMNVKSDAFPYNKSIR